MRCYQGTLFVSHCLRYTESSTERRRADDRAVMRTETTAGVRKRRIGKNALRFVRCTLVSDTRLPRCAFHQRIPGQSSQRLTKKWSPGHVCLANVFSRFRTEQISIDDVPYSTAYQVASDRAIQVLFSTSLDWVGRK